MCFSVTQWPEGGLEATSVQKDDLGSAAGWLYDLG